MSRFPNRTVILMALALFAFGWFWWRTHLAVPPAVTPIQVMVFIDGGVP